MPSLNGIDLGSLVEKSNNHLIFKNNAAEEAYRKIEVTGPDTVRLESKNNNDGHLSICDYHGGTIQKKLRLSQSLENICKQEFSEGNRAVLGLADSKNGIKSFFKNLIHRS